MKAAREKDRASKQQESDANLSVYCKSATVQNALEAAIGDAAWSADRYVTESTTGLDGCRDGSNCHRALGCLPATLPVTLVSSVG